MGIIRAGWRGRQVMAAGIRASPHAVGRAPSWLGMEAQPHAHGEQLRRADDLQPYPAAACTSGEYSVISYTWRISMVSPSAAGQRVAHATASSLDGASIIQ